VEDDADMRNLLVARLIKSFYEIIQAEDGEQAVAKFLSHRPQLILLDIMLPKMDGFEVLRAIREKSGETGLLPHIIILSNFQKPEYLAMAKEMDVKQYLIKSQTEIEDICKRVEETLAQK
ncbi:MAG: response regulator, partial [Candidatus Paceibacterales bacterium]